MKLFDLQPYCQNIVRSVEQNTGIPVCLGVAPTKALSKLANRFAKKYPAFARVCIMNTDEKIEKALKLTEIGDVGGIGRQYTNKLQKQGVKTAYDFTKMPKGWVRKNMYVVGEKLWRELQGESCLALENIVPDKKQICTSRSFGNLLSGFDDVMSAVASFSELCAFKLRQQGSCAVSLIVFISTNFFREDLPQYSKSAMVTLPVPSSSTTEIVRYARTALKQIYKEGFFYKKAGVIISQICPSSAVQGNIFDTEDRTKQAQLMRAIDGLNKAYGQNTVTLAAAFAGKHEMHRENLSPDYTTNLGDVIGVRV